jgi:hypothetical protein
MEIGTDSMKRFALIKAVFVIFLFVALSACDRTPRNIEDLSHKIRTVTYSEERDLKIARIELDGLFGSDEARYFYKASQEMFRILRKIAIYFPEDQQRVYFILKVRLQNIHGRSGERVVMEVPFSMTEVKKIKFYTSSNWDVLNRSDRVRFTHPVGRNIVRSFCAVENNGKHAKQFCLASL